MSSTALCWLGIGATLILLVLYLSVFAWLARYERDPYDEIDC